MKLCIKNWRSGKPCYRQGRGPRAPAPAAETLNPNVTAHPPATGEGEGLARLRQLLAPGSGAGGRGSGASAPGAHAGGGAPSLAVRLSALSPWLASGCLSPRRVYAEVRAGRCISTQKQHRAGSGPKPGSSTIVCPDTINDSLLPVWLYHRAREAAFPQ